MSIKQKIEDILLAGFGVYDNFTVDRLLELYDDWIEYDWDNVSSRPTKYGKYFVRRKDGKVHWETWNNSGWAYNGKVITHYRDIKPPY